jgi:hypothetical protein
MHESNIIACCIENFPIPQLIQLLGLSAPTAFDHVPATQLMQVALEPGLYFPAGQSLHKETESDPWIVEYLPMSQPSHEMEPETREYLPALQAKQLL